MSSKKRTAETAGVCQGSTSAVDNNLSRTPASNSTRQGPASHLKKRQRTEVVSAPSSASRYDRFLTRNVEETIFLRPQADSIHLFCPVSCPFRSKSASPRTSSSYQKRIEEAVGLCGRSDSAFLPSPRPKDLPQYDSSTKLPSPKRRKIRQEPERILDAPGLKNDYYINVLDWSSLNVIAVGLGSKAYTWEEASGKVTELMAVSWLDHISSVTFSPNGKHLAIGSELGRLQILDFSTKARKVRIQHDESHSITAMGWSKYDLLAVGDRQGNIKVYRMQGKELKTVMTSKAAPFSLWLMSPSTVMSHTQRVVAVKFSPDGRTLATGGNDNLVCLWDVMSGQEKPRRIIREHRSAVRAMAWCPWESNILATGGGLGDRTIRIFNARNGNCISSVETSSQVCAIVWSKAYKELFTSHSRTSDQLVLWNYPSMTKKATLVGHTYRPLFMALSPDGQTVVTGAGDENLRFWKCFETKPGQKMLKCPSAMLLEQPVPNVLR